LLTDRARPSDSPANSLADANLRKFRNKKKLIARITIGAAKGAFY
jgi:hypothetical protein